MACPGPIPSLPGFLKRQGWKHQQRGMFTYRLRVENHRAEVLEAHEGFYQDTVNNIRQWLDRQGRP